MHICHMTEATALQRSILICLQDNACVKRRPSHLLFCHHVANLDSVLLEASSRSGKVNSKLGWGS